MSWEFFSGLVLGIVIGGIAGFLIAERSFIVKERAPSPVTGGRIPTLARPKAKHKPKVLDDRRAFEAEQEKRG